ncbi:hypothetical protein ACLQ22_06315 [Micromonospora sp. DT178]|uniref:hypothetical protein n=1 Tax=Micromonospora sp. DT178 TaxID=3393436 RepID=UPI003CF8DE70
MNASRPVASEALADAVRGELVAAGLSVLPRDAHQDGPGGGASVFHGCGDDPGVWVGWVVGDVLRDKAVRALEAGAYRHDGSEFHPAMRHHWAVREAMAAAMAQVLGSAGFRVERNADDLQPGALLVRDRLPGPTWRDPVMPPLAGSAGYLPGVRVRLVEGDHAGYLTTVVGARWRTLPPDGLPDAYRVVHPEGAGELDVPATAVVLADEVG